MPSIKPGLYDQLITNALLKKITDADSPADFRPVKEELSVDDSHSILARHLSNIIGIYFKELASRDLRLSAQITLCNNLLQYLADQCEVVDIHQDKLPVPAERLLAIEPKQGPNFKSIERPDTPVATAALLTNSASDPSLLSQLKKEAASADSINILCSFIKWSGLRLLKDELEEFVNKPGARLRVLTTCYCGATDAKAVQWLAALPNTEVRISYDTEQTRLHAKAYQFVRDNEFGTSYIGSANISGAALTDGLEWTLKVAQAEQSYLWEKIAGTFEFHWNSPDFEAFSEGDLLRFKQALLREKFGEDTRDDSTLAFYDLEPYPFQQVIIDKLKAERDLANRQWQLVVAATGTGKTMIAAFDYRDYLRHWDTTLHGRNPRFLFIAHRKEILKQARQKFRGVLRNHNFGEILVDGHEPSEWNDVFASIQTWETRKYHEQLAPDYFDYIIVDEFHHAAAKTYQGLLNFVKPKVLMGLTATPERHDGLDVFQYFDGHITAQIRLPDAINRQLLTPFHYFCVTDSVDLTDVRWERGHYMVRELEDQYLNNDSRTALILDKINEYVTNPSKSRGLGFCVSQRHAAYMAKQFNEAGFPSLSLDANSQQQDRDTACQRLASGQLRFLFTVDLFNEGVDIPEIDLVLFLRPTESLTVFLQQLGRGLRRSSGKECLTVLDFVGRANAKYSFADRFAAILKPRRYPLPKEIFEGFPHLPMGCSIHMEKVAREHILENVNRALRDARNRWVTLVQEFEETSGLPLSLQHFIEFHNLDLPELYKRSTWFRLLSRAGKSETSSITDEDTFRKGCERLLYVNDPIRLNCLESIVTDDRTSPSFPPHLILMLAAMFGKPWTEESDPQIFARWLSRNPTYRQELLQLLPILRNGAEPSMRTIPASNIPLLALHARYTRDEILFAAGYWEAANKPRMTEGVLHLKGLKCDMFFITLIKNESEYSPTTLYADYAISPSLFHWQTQSRTSLESATAQRYINHKENGHQILLFVREQRHTATDVTAPYYYLGTATYQSHEGSRPVNIVWKLDNPMPAHLYRDTAMEVS